MVYTYSCLRCNHILKTSGFPNRVRDVIMVTQFPHPVCVMSRREDRELGATVDRITADINAAKEGIRVNSDVQRRNESNVANLEMQVCHVMPVKVPLTIVMWLYVERR